MNYLTLSKEEIDSINHYHIHNVDKWYRMMQGISSRLTSVRDGIIYLELHINCLETHDPEKTASKLMESWLRFNPELNGAGGFEVSVYITTQLSGILIKAEDCNSTYLDEIINRMKEEPERKLVFIYRGRTANGRRAGEDCPKISEN